MHCPACGSLPSVTPSSAPDWQSGLSALRRLRADSLQQNVLNFGTAVNACRRGTQWTLAITTLKKIVKFHLRTSVIAYNSVITSCANKHWLMGLALLSDLCMQDLQKSMQSSGAAISLCDVEGQWQDSMQLLHTFARLSMQRGIIPLNSAMSTCGSQEMWQLAGHLLQSARAFSLEASCISHNTAMSACSEAGHWHLSYSLLGGMQQQLVERTVVSYGALLDAKLEVQSMSWWLRALAHLEVGAK